MRGATHSGFGRGRGAIAVGFAMLALAGCRDAADADDDDAVCTSAKCDALDESSSDAGSTTADETDTAPEPSELDMACFERRDDAFNPNRLAFTDGALRWSCADVDSTPSGERGQEYCEYFSIVALPPSPSYPNPEPLVLGRNLGVDAADGQTPIPLDLDSEQVAALENAGDSIVGACVFTSWNADIEAPCGDTCDAGDVLGVPVEPEVFRMKFDPNTNEAALALIEDCTGLLPTEGDPTDPEDPYHDPFFRSCHLNADVNETQHRKSDNVICAASVRLAECGCAVASGAPLAETLAPPADLGFRLGGWSGPEALPLGCRYQDIVEGGNALVVCDLTGSEVLQNAAELKSYCRDRYADDVVVHIAVDATAIVCEPPTDGPYAEGCPPHPWVLTP
jgi:hypothetical protein